MGESSENGHTQEHDAENGAHQDKGGSSIPSLGHTKDADPVGDRFGTGHGRTTLSKGPKKIKGRYPQDQPSGGVTEWDRPMPLRGMR